MKLQNHATSRVGDQVKITADFKTSMNQAASAKLIIRKGEFHDPADTMLVHGDVRDVSGILFALAEIAWRDLGYRPDGWTKNNEHLLAQSGTEDFPAHAPSPSDGPFDPAEHFNKQIAHKGK
jgi:hypothetical protein